MATTGDRQAPYGSGRAREINEEEPKNVSQETRQQNNPSGVVERSTHQGWEWDIGSICASIGILELEEILKYKTFTKSETQRLMALLHSKSPCECDNAVETESNGAKPPPSPSTTTTLLRLEVEASTTTSGSLKKHKHGDGANFHAPVVGSRVVERDIIASTSVQHPTATMESLPEELLSKIFIRLLAKQLAQLRSVSKFWKALLSYPSFLKSHLHNNNNNHHQILLLFHDEEEVSKQVTAITRSLELTNFMIKVPAPENSSSSNRIRVIGSINGLICSTYDDLVFHIWNPSRFAALTLPPYSTPSHDYNDAITTYFQFGFDPESDDYKLVKLTGLATSGMFAVKWWLVVEIFSMRKGSWEFITDRFPSHITNIISEDCDGAGVEGHLHWLCDFEREGMHMNTMVAFDLGSETFREIPLPDSIHVDRGDKTLGVLGGKICVMSRFRGMREVWVMEESESESVLWVKRHVLSQFNADKCLLGFTSKGEFVMEGDGCLVLYDLCANKKKILECDPYCVNNVVEYADSLVWVAPIGGEPP